MHAGLMVGFVVGEYESGDCVVGVVGLSVGAAVGAGLASELVAESSNKMKSEAKRVIVSVLLRSRSSMFFFLKISLQNGGCAQKFRCAKSGAQREVLSV